MKGQKLLTKSFYIGNEKVISAEKMETLFNAEPCPRLPIPNMAPINVEPWDPNEGMGSSTTVYLYKGANIVLDRIATQISSKKRGNTADAYEVTGTGAEVFAETPERLATASKLLTELGYRPVKEAK